MRFRRLSTEELENLKDDFIQFLASQQITATDWEKMKKKEEEQVHQLLDIFSDIVFEKVFSRIEYLQHRSKNAIKVFHCQEEVLTMTGLQIEDQTKDLTNAEDLALLSNPDRLQGKVKIFQIEKEYTKSRPDDVFEMIERNGCQLAPDGMFQMLENMYKQTL